MIMEWIQSFEGIMTLSFGTLSIGSIITNASLMVRNIKSIGENAKTGKELSKANESVKLLKEDSEKKDKIMVSQSKQIVSSNAVNEMLLKVLSIIVASSEGIDPITKVELVNSMKDIQTKSLQQIDSLVQNVKEGSEDILEVIENSVENGKEAFENITKEIKKTVDKYKKG